MQEPDTAKVFPNILRRVGGKGSLPHCPSHTTISRGDMQLTPQTLSPTNPSLRLDQESNLSNPPHPYEKPQTSQLALLRAKLSCMSSPSGKLSWQRQPARQRWRRKCHRRRLTCGWQHRRRLGAGLRMHTSPSAADEPHHNPWTEVSMSSSHPGFSSRLHKIHGAAVDGNDPCITRRALCLHDCPNDSAMP